MKLFAFAALALTLLVATDAQQCKLEDPESGCKDLRQNGETSGGGRWYDASGPADQDGALPDCDWYGAYWDRCQRDGNQHKHFGMVACEACCVCGGGSTSRIESCMDEERWYVESNSGKQYDCDYFEETSNACDKHGDKEGRFDMTAEEACCACGGGVRAEPYDEDDGDW